MARPRLAVLQERFAEVRTISANVRFFTQTMPLNEEALVFLPGWGVPPTLWFPIAARLRNKFNVVIVENLGHGDSTLGEGVTRFNYLDWNANAVLEILDLLNIQKAHFVVHSMGGYTVKKIVAREPERVASIVFVCTPLLEPLSSFVLGDSLPVSLTVDFLALEAHLLRRHIDLFKSSKRVEDALVHAIRATNPQFLTDLGITPINARPFVNYILRTPIETIAIALKGMRLEGKGVEELPKIDKPSLYVAGERDWVVDIERIEALSQWHENSTMKTMKGAGHTPMSTHSRELLKLLFEFYHSLGVVGAADRLLLLRHAQI